VPLNLLEESDSPNAKAVVDAVNEAIEANRALEIAMVNDVIQPIDTQYACKAMRNLLSIAGLVSGGEARLKARRSAFRTHCVRVTEGVLPPAEQTYGR
jgi:hypothetical protein